jgi:UDP-N-acetylglucosamine acyltransferase
VNIEGLKRRGFSVEAIEAIRRAYKTLYRNGRSLADARIAIEAEAIQVPELRVLTDFLASAERGILR